MYGFKGIWLLSLQIVNIGLDMKHKGAYSTVIDVYGYRGVEYMNLPSPPAVHFRLVDSDAERHNLLHWDHCP
jgi:hypothetical protein